MYAKGAGAGSELGLPVALQFMGNQTVSTIQASAAFGFVRSGEKSSFNVDYIPSYVRGFSSSRFESTNHALALSVGRKLSSKWHLNGSVNGIVSDFDQLLFARSRSVGIATTPATFDDFSTALLTGRTANTGLAQAVNAAPVVGSPELAFLYGGRILSASLMGSLSYASSTRSTITFAVTSIRTQFLSQGNNLPEGAGGRAFSVPWTTNAIPAFNWSYSLTPRTTFGVNTSTNRTISRFQDVYVSQSGVSIGRTMSERWFLQGMVGAGWMKPLRETVRVSRRPQMTYGGSVGYKVYAQTFTGFFNRSVSDIYGLGASTMDMSNGAWSWSRPGSTVSLTASFGYSRFKSPSFSNIGSWTGMFSAGKSLNSQMAVSASYSYIQLPGSIVTAASNLTRSGAFVSLSWSPARR